MAKRTTIKDIADIAGVDHSTVSRALNDSPRVSEKTKARIRAIAEELHFEFNAVGRSLSRGKSGNIAVIHSGMWDGFGTSQYFNLLFSSMRKDLERHQMDALILEAYNPETGMSNIERLIRQQKVDGFLIVHSDIRKAEYDMMQHHEIPFVQLHSRPKYYPLEMLDHFLTDNEAGGYLAAEHLVSKGCSRIVNLTAGMDLCGESRRRFEGYSRALAEHDILVTEHQVLKTECSFQSGYQTVYANRELFERSDALFAQADIVAFGAISALKELGFAVPSDIMVAGFDDTPLCTLTTPGITSVHQPVEKLTEHACTRIYDLLNGRNTAMRIQENITPWLVERGSTQKI